MMIARLFLAFGAARLTEEFAVITVAVVYADIDPQPALTRISQHGCRYSCLSVCTVWDAVHSRDEYDV